MLFFDEIDALRGESLRSVLCQLRSGHPGRPGRFPASVVLCGQRSDPTRLGTSSPFNIKVASLRLGDFTEADVGDLYRQHTAAIGQPFTDQAKERLILARATHLDSLAARLNEPSLRNVIEPLIAGELGAADPTYTDDIAYLRDLGLLAPTRPARIANPIYREVIVRVLGDRTEEAIVR